VTLLVTATLTVVEDLTESPLEHLTEGPLEHPTEGPLEHLTEATTIMATTIMATIIEETGTMAATIGTARSIKLLNAGKIAITDLHMISIKEAQQQKEIDRPFLTLKENENYSAL
jgi:hypothetical protein